MSGYLGGTNGTVDLLSEEAAADSYYGFPSGTMAALGATESSQGTNLGTIGNIFQIEPATATSPGYGLSSLNGNSAFDAGAYLSALLTGPANGNLATATAMYQGGPGNPVPYSASSPMGQFLSDLGLGGGTSSTGPANNSVNTLSTPETAGQGVGSQPSGSTAGVGAVGTAITQGLESALLWAASPFIRVLILLFAIILVTIGLAALALKTEPAQVVRKLKDTAAEAAIE